MSKYSVTLHFPEHISEGAREATRALFDHRLHFLLVRGQRIRIHYQKRPVLQGDTLTCIVNSVNNEVVTRTAIKQSMKGFGVVVIRKM